MNTNSIVPREPEPDKYELLKAMRENLQTSFISLQSWGVNAEGDRDSRIAQEEKIRNYLQGLSELQSEILSDYLDERRELVERYASPCGAWYLFTLREARDMFAGSKYAPQSNESLLAKPIPNSEREWFARRFLEKWNAEGERLFLQEEWNEMQFVRRAEYDSPGITLQFGRPMNYSWKNEFDFYLDIWYRTFQRYGLLFESGLTVDLKEIPELFHDYQELRRVAELLSTKKNETGTNPVSIDHRFRQFERSIGYECDRLSLITWEEVKGFTDTIGDPLEQVDFLNRIADLRDDGITDSIVNRETYTDGRLLHRRNQEDIIQPLSNERRRLLNERFNIDQLVLVARGIKNVRERLRYLITEQQCFYDYNPLVRSGSIESHVQPFYFGLKEEINATNLLVTAEGTENEDRTLSRDILKNAPKNSPRILRDLSTDSRFDNVRSFLTELEHDNGKLIWPNHPHRSKVPKPERIRKYDLPLLLHHLVQKEGLPESYSSHAFATTMFLWRDRSEIRAEEFRKKLNESNNKVEDLPPGRVTDMIRRIYSS